MHFVNPERTLRYYQIRRQFRFCFLLAVAIWISYQMIYADNLLEISDWLTVPSTTSGLIGILQLSPILAVPAVYLFVARCFNLIFRFLYRQAELDAAHRDMRALIARILAAAGEPSYQYSTKWRTVHIHQTSSKKHPTYRLIIERADKQKVWMLTEERFTSSDEKIGLYEVQSLLSILKTICWSLERSQRQEKFEW